MNTLQLSASILLLIVFEMNQVSARYDRIGYISDPIELLIQNAPSSLQNQDYVPIKRPYRRVEKRRYSSFPPSFYSSNGDMGNQRHLFLPYADLLFSGR